jgi:hypothetical protein
MPRKEVELEAPLTILLLALNLAVSLAVLVFSIPSMEAAPVLAVLLPLNLVTCLIMVRLAVLVYRLRRLHVYEHA